MSSVTFHTPSSSSFTNSGSVNSLPATTLEAGIEKIQMYWKENKSKENPGPIADFHKNILNCYGWAKATHVQIPGSVVTALIAFSNQTGLEFEIIQKWIKETTESLTLEFLINKFESSSKELAPNKETRMWKFISRTTLALRRKIEQRQIVEPETLKKYVKIMVANFGYDKRTSIEKLTPLLDYLERTQYAQCRLIVEAALDVTGMHTHEFITTLMTNENLNSHLYLTKTPDNQNGQVVGHVMQGIAALLHSSNLQLNTFATDILFRLLPDKEMVPFLEKEVFNSFSTSAELLYCRITMLMKDVVTKKDGKTHSRIHYLMQLVMKNKQLVNRLNNRESPLEESLRESLLKEILETYTWQEVGQGNKNNLKKIMFNPMFYQMEKFLKITNSEMQNSIILLFITFISYQGAGEDLVDAAADCTAGIALMANSLKMCVAKYDCIEMFDGAATNYFSMIITRVFQINHLVNVSYQAKIDAINTVIDSYLLTNLEHIGRLQEKNGIPDLTREIDANFKGLTSANLPEKVKEFSGSFSHILFHALYSDEDFKKWFRNENPLLVSKQSEVVEGILSKMGSVREAVAKEFGPTFETFHEGRYKRIHNNQIGSLAAIESCIERFNVFLKIGTGQGKSLIAEMAAIRLLRSREAPKKVFIFTSYDHLAKRDWESMKFLPEANRYTSIYISENDSFDDVLKKIKNASIIHVDSTKFQLFLARNFAKFLDSSQSSSHRNISDLMKILFNQQDNAVILDEGDLMIIDDHKSTWIYPFTRLFGNAAIEMSTSSGEAEFNRLIGNSLIQDFNQTFSNSYNDWYSRVKGDDKESVEDVNEASGKKSRYAEGFARRISHGNYDFHSLFMSFSSYVRSFKQVLFLSGSIKDDHMRMFDHFFTNGKPNLFANIPLFAGTHNLSENLREVTVRECRSDNEWQSTILQDLKGAMQRGQPILVFVDPVKLDTMHTYLSQHLDLKPEKWITIKHESDVEALTSEIGKIGNITLATTVCGRGVDPIVSQTVEWSLHVVVTKLPDNANDRLLTQMLGRTARLRKGTYSIIVDSNYTKFKQDAANQLKKSLVTSDLQKHDRRIEISQLFLTRHAGSMCDDLAKKWVLVCEMIHHRQIDVLNDAVYQNLQRFLQVNADGHTNRENYEFKEKEKKG